MSLKLIDLNPVSQVSPTVLPATGSAANVNDGIPYGIYSNPSSEFYSTEFLTGAADQVAHTYKKLGGEVLDVELTERSVYANYEEATLEYGYIVNVHQAKNVLSRMLGTETGSFDSNGTLESGSLKTSLSGSHANLKYPKFSFQMANNIMAGAAAQVVIGQKVTEYSASFDTVLKQQDYDLQKVVSTLAAAGTFGPYFSLGNKRIKVTKVYYMGALAGWRFFNFGQFGSGLSLMGNGSMYGSYGQMTDDSTWEVIPTWQNKLQAINYKDTLRTRYSNYSYELIGSKLRIYPEPAIYTSRKMWFKFVIEDNPFEEPYEEDGTKVDSGINGVNNLNNAPFEVIPYNSINSIGKNFIKRFCYALSLNTLGEIRSKFDPIPIPTGNINLNGKELIAKATEEQTNLRKELIDTLDTLTYNSLASKDKALIEDIQKIATVLPMPIFVG